QHSQLNIEGQTRRNPIRINFLCSPPFGFKEHLMAFFISKAMSLVFYRWAIPGAYTFDRSMIAIHWRPIKPGTYDVVGSLISMSYPTWKLFRMHIGRSHERKYGYRVRIAGLYCRFTEIDRASVNPGRGSRFQTPLRKLKLFQAFSQTYRRWIT